MGLGGGGGDGVTARRDKNEGSGVRMRKCEDEKGNGVRM